MNKKHEVYVRFLLHDHLYVYENNAKRYEDGKDTVKRVYVVADCVTESTGTNALGSIFTSRTEAYDECDALNNL